VSASYLTIAEVVDEFRRSPRTGLRWVEQGEFEAVRLPGARCEFRKVRSRRGSPLTQ
jgi:hypothetical protein